MSDMVIKKLNEVAQELKVQQNETPEVRMLHTAVDEIHVMNNHRQGMRYANAALMALLLLAFVAYALIVRQASEIMGFVGFVIVFLAGIIILKYMDYLDTTKIMDTFMSLSKNYRAKKSEQVQSQQDQKQQDKENMHPKYL